jgi:hypothetical protein
MAIAARDQESLRLEIGHVLQVVFADPDRIPEFFTDDYTQTTNGAVSDRTAFEAYVRHVARTVRSVQFEVLDAARQDATIADRHLVHVTDQNGGRATIEVYLFGTLVDGRLQRVHEATRLLSGEAALEGLGSARE